MPSNHLILGHPLLLLPPIPSSIRVFSNESTLRMRWPKYWSFNFSISASNEYPGLISFRMDWLDLLEVQGTLQSLLQHHSSIASILWHSAFFTVRLSHPYMTTGKTTAWLDGLFISSVQFSCSVVSDSLQPHELQHPRPPCPSPSAGVHSDSCPSSRWCHPAISSSVVPFYSCPQSLSASESFPMSQLKSQGWSSEWIGWISLQFKGLSRVFSNTTVQNH